MDLDAEGRTTLDAVAEDLTAAQGRGRRRPIIGDVVAPRHVELLSALAPRSLLLGGPPGAGKSTWVRALARRLGRDKDAPRVWSTSADRIVAGMK